MSTRRLIRAIQNLFHHMGGWVHDVTKGLMSWLLRGLLVIGRQPLRSKAGFVLPTTVILLLVVTLTVGSIGFRTYTRSQQAIGERQQRVIFNAATPAIDRAKAKLEYLFDPQRDTRFPGGIPSEVQLMGMMLNDAQPLAGNVIVPRLAIPNAPANSNDPYTFPGEVRVDLNNDGRLDNAWRYRVDSDGDGTEDSTAVYSVLFQTPSTTNVAENERLMRDTTDAGINTKAGRLIVRHGPLSNNTDVNACAAGRNNATAPEGGWFPDTINTSTLRKNFQVNAYVVPDNPNGTRASLELHQDREVERGNKWGAWFRNDLEVFAGPRFNWNGAMHTEGNLIVGFGADNPTFNSFMISSPFSCLYTREASEITVANVPANIANNIPAFRGHIISGRTGNNQFGNSSFFHLFNGVGQAPINTGDDVTLTSGRDSVGNEGGRGPADFSLSPIMLQTRDLSLARNLPPNDPNNPIVDPAWEDKEFFKRRRIYNQTEKAPYVDDSYRADNRLGPKPAYEPPSGRIDNFIIGGSIPAADTSLVGDDPPAQDATNFGLDGYWERRARSQGLRLIVGQRLELGNGAGWSLPIGTEGINPIREPLKPWRTCTSNNSNRCAEARQRKALWDNLAAVQSTAVYHANNPAGRDIPVACLATTVHPGTARTLANSSTFENILASGVPSSTFGSYPRELIITDFFSGRGTNGWEFNVPPASVFVNGSNMMRALTNLAQFAGDPSGGAPSFTPVQDRTVHPYPSLAMWGDFSILRRVLNLMSPAGSNLSFAQLSPADKSTLYTSACTLGMLAFNVDYLQQVNVGNLPTNIIGNANTSSGSIEFFKAGLYGSLRALMVPPAALDDNPNNDDWGLAQGIRNQLNGDNGGEREILPPPDIKAQFNRLVTTPNDVSSYDPEAIVRLLERWRDSDGVSADKKAELNGHVALARLIMMREQVARDRAWGFQTGLSRAPLGNCEDWVANNNPARQPLRIFCSNRPRYPILYSLFTANDTNNDNIFEPHGEQVANAAAIRTRDIEDNGDVYLTNINSGVTYDVVAPGTIALLPRTPAGISVNGAQPWVLPTAASSVAVSQTPNNNQANLIKVCMTSLCSTATVPSSGGGGGGGGGGSVVNIPPRMLQIPFKDAAFFDGREMMNVRTLDLDLGMMRQSAYQGNFWLPQSGIIYAFREDAMSESSIVRPTAGVWTTCSTDQAVQTIANCRMNVDGNVTAANSTDPPVNANNRITPKPVDYYADPDRRPYGFRLRNGTELGRAGDEGRGLSFITDNLAYVQGFFNLHQNAGGNRLEEFLTLLSDNDQWTNFYTRQNTDTRFATQTEDRWRPTEILADAVVLLSNHFCDGSIEDGFRTAGAGSNANLPDTYVQTFYGCPAGSGRRTSYLNQNRPRDGLGNNLVWFRANLTDTEMDTDNARPGNSPIVVSRNGNPLTWNTSSQSRNEYDGSSTNNRYYAWNEAKPLIAPENNTRMNFIMISGIVPSRENQSYGGLHNFPRFLENWDSRNLYLSGSFIQLNFSKYATGPYEQDAYEPGQPPTNDQNIQYYGAPRRRWGYDVGLQKAPAGPLAQRFVTSKAIRSEFYNEPPANDPYIRRLCQQVPGANCPPAA